jgi:hypothetical protein
MSQFSVRGFISLLLSFAFVLVVATGLVLWLSHSPQTLGIGQGVWKHTHIWASLLMTVAAVFHLALNWSVYRIYWWEKAAARLNQKREIAMAMGIMVAIVAVAMLSPADNMMRRLTGMNLPQVAAMSGQSVDSLVAVLEKEGIAVHNPADSLREIAEHNNVPIQRVATVIQSQMHGGPAEREAK